MTSRHILHNKIETTYYAYVFLSFLIQKQHHHNSIANNKIIKKKINNSLKPAGTLINLCNDQYIHKNTPCADDNRTYL